MKPGQFIFGRLSAAKELRSKPDATYKRMLKLKKLGNITTQNRTHFTVITINNWDFYQNQDADITNQVTTKYQPSNTNKNVKNDKKKDFSSDSVEYGLAEFLFNQIRLRKDDYKKPNLQTWAKHIDYLIRLDKRDPDRIKEVIEWCQRDEFWQDNILSTIKLR